MGISFNLQDSFEEFLTDDYRCFLTMLRIIEEAQPNIEMERKARGRIPYENAPIMRAFLACVYFRIASVEDLRKRLLNDPNLRMICGFHDGIPSAPTFSRRMATFCAKPVMTQTLNNLVASYQKDYLVGHINRDSPAIPVRETSINNKKEVTPVEAAKRTRVVPETAKNGQQNQRPSSNFKGNEVSVTHYPNWKKIAHGAARRIVTARYHTGRATSCILMSPISVCRLPQS
jgi:hypothetical protein